MHCLFGADHPSLVDTCSMSDMEISQEFPCHHESAGRHRFPGNILPSPEAHHPWKFHPQGVSSRSGGRRPAERVPEPGASRPGWRRQRLLSTALRDQDSGCVSSQTGPGGNVIQQHEF